MNCPVCHMDIENNPYYHKIEGEYYAYYFDNKTFVKCITYRWDRIPLLTSSAPLNTKINIILTLDGLHVLTMERVEKLLLLK